ncbi:MAG TPA: BON domain-containing protein, partial [Gammaproteobacteria bacterium]|nr:BON domain-containing protein [Gammaproteobacteria bacterium]
MQVKTYAQLVVSLMLSVPLAAYADNVVQDVGHGVGEVASGVWEGTKDIGTGIGNAAHDIGRGINNAFTGGGNGGVRNSSDQTITNTVKSSLAVDPSISNTADITVTTKNGVVDLSGTVDNQAQAAKAIEIAASI